jgi:hypothetical protein
MMTIIPTFTEGEFRKASASNPDRECVRVARRDGWVEIRDDKTIFGSSDDRRLLLNAAEFDHFQASARAGVVDDLCIEMIPHADGTYTLRKTGDQSSAELKFSRGEVEAFLTGVRTGEFDLTAYAA